MSIRHLIYLALPLLLCTCDTSVGNTPDPPLEQRIPDDMEWVLTEGTPLNYSTNTNKYGNFRLEVVEDTARLYQPFLHHEEHYPAYEADSTERFADSLYMTYSLRADSSLEAVVRSHTGQQWPQRYVLTHKLDSHPLPQSVVGQTYKLTYGGTPYLINFSELTGANKHFNGKVAHLIALVDESDRLARSSGKFGIPNMELKEGTISIYFNLTTRPGGVVRYNIMLLCASATGEPQVYVLLDDDGQQVVEGPLPLRPYASIVPPQTVEADLMPLLNRGRISVRKLTEEPDSVGVKYAYEEDFVAWGGIEAAELDRLDFEFRADSTYSVFVGDRLLNEGYWALSPDRNFILTARQVFSTDILKFIHRYSDDEIAFPIRLKLKTSKPKGTKLLSYYNAELLVSFVAEE